MKVSHDYEKNNVIISGTSGLSMLVGLGDYVFRFYFYECGSCFLVLYRFGVDLRYKNFLLPL